MIEPEPPKDKTPKEIEYNSDTIVIQIPERRPRGQPPKRRPNFILEVGVYLNDIKDIDNQFITAIWQGINLKEVFITWKEEADLKLTLELRQKGVITTLGQPFQAS